MKFKNWLDWRRNGRAANQLLVTKGSMRCRTRGGSGVALCYNRSNMRGGYLKVNLWKRNKCRSAPIHALVLEAFVGPRPAGYYGCHNNNIPGDNRRWNLRWDTPKANSADQIKHGTKRLADRHHNAKLTSEAVREIRATSKRGSGSSLARKFGVTEGTISLVRSRKIWA